MDLRGYDWPEGRAWARLVRKAARAGRAVPAFEVAQDVFDAQRDALAIEVLRLVSGDGRTRTMPGVAPDVLLDSLSPDQWQSLARAHTLARVFATNGWGRFPNVAGLRLITALLDRVSADISADGDGNKPWPYAAVNALFIGAAMSWGRRALPGPAAECRDAMTLTAGVVERVARMAQPDGSWRRTAAVLTEALMGGFERVDLLARHSKREHAPVETALVRMRDALAGTAMAATPCILTGPDWRPGYEGPVSVPEASLVMASLCGRWWDLLDTDTPAWAKPVYAAAATVSERHYADIFLPALRWATRTADVAAVAHIEARFQVFRDAARARAALAGKAGCAASRRRRG